jgi:lysosomal Pro-X carboxypeptidase
MEWLTQHCLSRFNVVPKPYQLVYEWKFNDLVGQGASRILFTNGRNDMWSAGSYLEDISDSILTINMPNGAHHSELSHANAQNLDTDDVRDAHDEIVDILSRWLDEVRGLQKP